MKKICKRIPKRLLAVLMVLILVIGQLPANLGIAFGESTSEPSFDIVGSDGVYTGVDEDLYLELLNTEYNGEDMESTVALTVYGISTPLDENEDPMTELATYFQIEFESTVAETVYGEEYTPDFEFIGGYFVEKDYDDLYYYSGQEFGTKDSASEKAIPVDTGKWNEIELYYENESIKFYWNPDHSDFIIDDLEYTDDEDVDIELWNIDEDDQVVVYGTSIVINDSGEEEATAFKVVFNEERDDYRKIFTLGGHFTDKYDDTYCLVDEDLNDKDDDEMYAIPVDKSQNNTIIFEYDEETVEFYWQPGDVWTYAYKETDYINENPTVDVIIENFSGNSDNLYVELLTENPVVTIGKLGTVSSEVYDDNQKLFTFSYQSEYTDLLGNDFTDDEMNNKWIQAKLVYDEDQDGVADKTEQLWGLKIDNMPPDPHAWFEGEEDNYYVIKVNFNDDVKLSSISTTSFVLKTEEGVEGIHPIEIEFIGDETCYEVELYFAKESFTGNILAISDLEDIAGHYMDEKIIEFHTDAYVSGNVKDEDGIVISDIEGGEFILVPEDLDLSTFDFENDEIDEYVEYVYVDSDGSYHRWMEAGTYKAYNLTIWDEDDEKVYSIDETINVPYTLGEDVYTYDIQIPSANVFGKVYREDEELYTEELLIIDTDYIEYIDDYEYDHDEVFEIYGKIVETDEDGDFSLYLPAGEYEVLGKKLGFTVVYPIGDYIFTVDGEGTVNLVDEIVFPAQNISGNIFDNEGYPLENGQIVIMNDSGTFFEAMTDYEGDFKVALVDGSYVLSAVTTMFSDGENGSMYFINQEFQVLNEDIVLVDNENPLEDIQLPDPNLEIKLTKGGEIFQGKAEMEFEFEMDAELMDPEIYTETGVFEFYLTPGTYEFTGLWVFDESIHEHIEIEDLELVIAMDENSDFTGEDALEIDLDDAEANSSNAVLTLLYEDGTPLDGYWIQIKGIDNSTDFWINTDSSGRIYEYLEPGLYVIGGYEKYENFKELNYEFEITSKHTVENKFEEVIVVKLPNITGIVKDTNDNPIPYAWVDLEKLPNTNNGELFSKYMGFNADEDGEFEIYLESGEYIVRGIWNNNTQEWQEVNFTFEVIEGETITNLVIQKPQDNIVGYVFEEYDAESGEGIPFDGSSYYYGDEDDDFNHVWLVLREADVVDDVFNETPWLYEKWIHVEADGSFSEYLDPGKDYEAFAVSTPREYIELNPNGDSEVIITPPSLDLIIVPPAPNFGGQLLDYDGNPIPNAFINLEKADYTEWFGTETDENGYFGLSLEAGEEYIIRDAFYRIDYGEQSYQDYYDYSMEQRITFNQKIVVDENTVDLELKPNLKGNLNIGDIEISEYDYVGISIRRVVSEDDSNYEDYEMNPWKYEYWMDVKYDDGSNIGEFTGYLEDGRYEIVGVSDPNGWKQLGIEFVLDKSSNDLVIYDSSRESYEINIEYAPNVSGIVLDKDGNPEAEAWINIERIVQEEYYDESTTGYNDDYYYNRWFGTNTDGNGEFSIKLTDGDYKVTGYSTTGYWDGDTWINGKWVSVYYTFKVANGELVDINSDPISTIEIKPNVSGYVEKYNKDTDSFEVVPYSWIKIKPADENGEVDYENWIDDKWANSDENGEFTLMLQTGKYKIVEAGGHDLWMLLSIDFEIDAAGNLVENDNVVNGEIIVRSQRPNLKGYVKDEDGNILPNSHIAIKPLEAGEHDWNNVKWVETDDEGYFELKIDDGDWKVAYISAPNMWMRTYIPFTIEGENISSSMEDIVQDGLLEVKPPTPNLVGIVKDEDGNQITSRAWLSIKPADAGIHDWENSHWVEYKEYDGEYKFKYYMEPGEYKVVNVGSYNLGYETDIRFEIGSNGELISSDAVINGELIITPPEPNVVGTVFTEINDSEVVVNNGWIGIARFDDEGNQLTMEGEEITGEKYYNEDDIYWHHTRWTLTDENGSFELRIDSGLYKVISVSGNGVWYKADTEFTVNDGEIANVDVRKPGPNVTITVNNTGLNDNEAWIDIQMNRDGYKYYMPAELKSASDGQYVFEVRLEDGQYLIKSFGTPSYWTEVEHEFSVTNEEIQLNVMVDFNNETKKKVSGQIKQNGTNVSEKVWVAIQPVVNGDIDTSEEKRWIQTTEDGGFTFKLNAGETWTITDITTSDGYNTVTNPLNYSITVGDTEEQSSSEWIVDLDTL